MHHQKLDDDGLASSYLTLTALLPLGMYWMYRSFYPEKSFACSCNNCSRKKPKRKTGLLVLQGIYWAVIAVLLKNILTIKIKSKAVDFDPYAILGVSSESSLPEIKKSFRKILKSYRAKLNTTETKEEAEKGMKNLNKAFNILKDPESLSRWMRDDGTRELMIALPSALLQFSTPLLLVYTFVLAVAVPLYFFRKQHAFKRTSFSGSDYHSNEMFLEQVEGCSDLPQIAIQHILVIMGRSVEFSTRVWRSELRAGLVKELEMDYAFPVMVDSPGYLYILEYLFRKLDNDEDREFVWSSILKLIESYMKIALARRKTRVFEALVTLQKMVHQAVFHPEYYRLQYPFVTFDSIYSMNAVEAEGQSPGKKHANTKSDSQFLTEVLSSSKLKISLNVLNSIPRVSIKEFVAYTLNTETNDESSFEKDFDKIIKREGDSFMVEKNAVPTIQLKLVSNGFYPICHTPFCSEPLRNKWIVYHKINDKIQNSIVILDAFEGTKKIKLSLPSVSTKDHVKVYVSSNGYFGNDVSSSLTIKSY